MASIQRIDEPGMVHHVIQTSVAEARVFANPADREWYRERLRKIAREEGVRVFAGAWMDTHVHLLMLVSGMPLRRVMARVGTGFAMQFNRRNGRKGRVFGEPFWNRPMQSELQFRRTLRYIVLNPLNAGIVKDLSSLERSDRTSLPVLLGHRAARLEDVPRVLRHFGQTPSEAAGALRDWLASADDGFDPTAALDPQSEEDLRLLREGSEALRDSTRRAEMRVRRREAGWDLEAVVRYVCARFEVDSVALADGSKSFEVAAARATACHLAVNVLGFPIASTAECVGVQPSAVSNALARGRRIAALRGLSLDQEGPGASSDGGNGTRRG